MTGRKLKRIRKKLGLTQRELADAMGYSKVAIQKKELNERPINVRDEKMLHQLLEINGLLNK